MTLYRQALDELGTVMDRIDDEAVDTACRMIARANRITQHKDTIATIASNSIAP